MNIKHRCKVQIAAQRSELGTHGVAAIPFKGPTLAAYAYGSTALRRFGDLDLLVRENRVVAEVRIAVDHAEAAEWEPPGGEHRGGDAVAHRELGFGVVEQPPAFEPVESEQTAG